jgi:hypothetical protein
MLETIPTGRPPAPSLTTAPDAHRAILDAARPPS